MNTRKAMDGFEFVIYAITLAVAVVGIGGMVWAAIWLLTH